MCSQHVRLRVLLLASYVWLTTGAFLKLIDLIQQSNSVTWQYKWGYPILIMAELLCASTFILFGTHIYVKILAATIFLAFAAVHLGTILGALPACGCMGQYTPNPWYMLTTNTIFAAFYIKLSSDNTQPLRSAVPPAITYLSVMPVPIAMAIIVIPSIHHRLQKSLHEHELASAIVTCTNRIPALSNGQWNIIFIRSDCQKCSTEMEALWPVIEATQNNEPQWCIIDISSNSPGYTIWPRSDGIAYIRAEISLRISDVPQYASIASGKMLNTESIWRR